MEIQIHYLYSNSQLIPNIPPCKSTNVSVHTENFDEIYKTLCNPLTKKYHLILEFHVKVKL